MPLETQSQPAAVLPHVAQSFKIAVAKNFLQEIRNSKKTAVFLRPKITNASLCK